LPAEQVNSKPQASGSPLQVAVAPVAVGQGVQSVPQFSGDWSSTQCPLHKWYPVLHRIPHRVPSHVARPAGSVGQASQAVPQLDVLVFATQLLPHKWYPESQVSPQARGEPLQVAVLWVG
jgi:hypothetical protein